MTVDFVGPVLMNHISPDCGSQLPRCQDLQPRDWEGGDGARDRQDVRESDGETDTVRDRGPARGRRGELLRLLDPRGAGARLQGGAGPGGHVSGHVDLAVQKPTWIFVMRSLLMISDMHFAPTIHKIYTTLDI